MHVYRTSEPHPVIIGPPFSRPMSNSCIDIDMQANNNSINLRLLLDYGSSILVQYMYCILYPITYNITS
jgi:hypothetical protein